MSSLNISPLKLDEISLHSHWPKRLLGLDPFSVKPKTFASVQREFGQDKWGALLQQTEANPSFGLCEVEGLEVNLDALTPFFEKGNFYLASERVVLEKHLALYAEVLTPHLKNASALVEMGAGFGSKLLNLAKQKTFAHLPLFAAEFTESGQKLLRLLSEREGHPVDVGFCDFGDPLSCALPIPTGSVIFTSYAAHYIPELPANFPNFFAKFKPQRVIHFEPCYEHFDSGQLHDLMCQRYFQLNDYTRNLVSVLKNAQAQGKLRIMREEKKVLGGNPFLPVSILEWEPIAGR